jgi:hypothetical protein
MFPMSLIVHSGFSLRFSLTLIESALVFLPQKRRRGRDGMVVGFMTTYVISSYNH